MERGAAARGVGGVPCKHGRIYDGRCGRLDLGCTLLPVSAKARFPHTRNLMEIWACAFRHRIYLVACTVDLLPTLTNAYRVPSIITGLRTTETRVSSHESGYAHNLQNAHYDVFRKIITNTPPGGQNLAQNGVFTPRVCLHSGSTGSNFRSFGYFLRSFLLLIEIYPLVPSPPSVRLGFSRYTPDPCPVDAANPSRRREM